MFYAAIPMSYSIVEKKKKKKEAMCYIEWKKIKYKNRIKRLELNSFDLIFFLSVYYVNAWSFMYIKICARTHTTHWDRRKRDAIRACFSCSITLPWAGFVWLTSACVCVCVSMFLDSKVLGILLFVPFECCVFIYSLLRRYSDVLFSLSFLFMREMQLWL